MSSNEETVFRIPVPDQHRTSVSQTGHRIYQEHGIIILLPESVHLSAKQDTGTTEPFVLQQPLETMSQHLEQPPKPLVLSVNTKTRQDKLSSRAVPTNQPILPTLPPQNLPITPVRGVVTADIIQAEEVVSRMSMELVQDFPLIQHTLIQLRVTLS